ncbi:hypothetical protein NUACC21_49150 [Scytonema sp. NUACC21]
MLKRISALWLAPVVVTLSGFMLDAKAFALPEFPFETVQEYKTTLVPIEGNISKVTNIGISVDAPYGLTQLINTNYGELDPNTGAIRFSPDAATFGLKGLPIGEAVFFGNGLDRLFGTISGSGVLDFQASVGNISGNITITGGEGRFSDATGILTFVENNTFNSDPTAPINSRATVIGSFQVIPRLVPEQGATTAIVGALAGACLWLRRRNYTNL